MSISSNVTDSFADLESSFFVVDPPLESPSQDESLEADFLLVEGDPIVTSSKKFLNYSPNWTRPLNTWMQQVQGYLYRPSLPEKVPTDMQQAVELLCLYPGAQLRQREVIACIDKLKHEPSNSKWDYLTEGMLNPETTQCRTPSYLINLYLNDFINKVDLLFIPFVFKGSNFLQQMYRGTSAHIVLITIDFRKKVIEYYDSLAFQPKEWTYYPQFCMQEDLLKVMSLCFPEEASPKIYINSVVQQSDNHNCGIYVLHYIKERIEGKNMETITQTAITQDKIQNIRLIFANFLCKK